MKTYNQLIYECLLILTVTESEMLPFSKKKALDRKYKELFNHIEYGVMARIRPLYKDIEKDGFDVNDANSKAAKMLDEEVEINEAMAICIDPETVEKAKVDVSAIELYGRKINLTAERSLDVLEELGYVKFDTE